MKAKYLKFIGEKLRPVELRLLVKWLLRLKRKQVVLPDKRVYEIDPISDLGLKITQNQAYEPEMTQCIEQLLEKGDSFIDLGANEGYFTVLASSLVSSTGKIYSIEPQKRLWEVIKQNVMLNSLSNVQLLPYGIGSEKQELVLQLYPSTNSGATSFSTSFNFKIAFDSYRKKLYGTQLSKVIRLDDLSDIMTSKIKLIKIDIEGYELEALKGATELLKNKRFDYLLVEIHHQALAGLNQSEDMIDDLLKEFSYTKKQIGSNLNLYSLQ